MNLERTIELPSVSEHRKEILREVFNDLKESGAVENFEAIIGFGSTFRGDAREDSDVDIMCITKNGLALEGKDWKVIENEIEEKLPDVVIQSGGGSKEMVIKFITRNNTGKEPAWEVLYSKGDATALNSEIEKLKTKK